MQSLCTAWQLQVSKALASNLSQMLMDQTGQICYSLSYNTHQTAERKLECTESEESDLILSSLLPQYLKVLVSGRVLAICFMFVGTMV